MIAGWSFLIFSYHLTQAKQQEFRSLQWGVPRDKVITQTGSPHQPELASLPLPYTNSNSHLKIKARKKKAALRKSFLLWKCVGCKAKKCQQKPLVMWHPKIMSDFCPVGSNDTLSFGSTATE